MPPENLPAHPVTGLSRARWALALGIAIVSDAVSVIAELMPFVQWAVDVATALALVGVMGWRWALLPALIAEAIPGLAIFPTWMLVVSSMAVAEKMRSPSPPADGSRDGSDASEL